MSIAENQKRDGEGAWRGRAGRCMVLEETMKGDGRFMYGLGDDLNRLVRAM